MMRDKEWYTGDVLIKMGVTENITLMIMVSTALCMYAVAVYIVRHIFKVSEDCKNRRIC